MNRFLTGNLDADRLILMLLDDRELFFLCIPSKPADIYNKYAEKLANEDFWRNRVGKYFPLAYNDKDNNLSWKKYYRSLTICISRLADKILMKKLTHQPFDGIKYPGNPIRQYIFFKNFRNMPPLGSLLLRAAQEGEMGIFQYLIERGDLPSGFFYNSALRSASTNGHLHIVKYLVEKGANIHVFQDYPLRYASKNGHLHIVKYLVEKGADIHACDNEALFLAIKNGHTEVINYLQSLSNKL